MKVIVANYTFINGPDIFPIEIKSGMTITNDYFKGITHFAKLFPEHMPWDAGLVYGGEKAQQRTGVTIAPLRDLNSLFNFDY